MLHATNLDDHPNTGHKMPSGTRAELAMEKMLEAAKALEDYFRSGAPDAEKYKQFAKAAKAALDEFSPRLSMRRVSRFS